MSAYAAPLEDMRFAIRAIAGLDRVLALPPFSEVTPDLVDQVLEEAARFAAGELAPLNRVGDLHKARHEHGAVVLPPGFREAYRQFADAGWNGLAAPAEFGGQGLPSLVAFPVSEMWNSANMAFCLCPMLTSGVVEALARVGSPEQRARYLPALVSGRWTGTMNLTEPQAGSDLAAVRTRAEPQADGTHRIFGQKIYITYGEHDLAENIVHLVLARTPDAPEGVQGISLFVVPKFLVNEDGTLGARNDVRCVSIEHKLGIHASPTCVLAYGDQGGATGYLVGRENEGLRYMFIMMNHARLGVGMEGVAMAERAYQQARAYAAERIQGRDPERPADGRVPIVRHPDVRRMLMSMRARIEAMRALAYTAAAHLDLARHDPDDAARAGSQALVDLLTPVVKGWCTEQGVEIASLGMQVHGGMGYIEETGAAQLLRDARITTIYEGTTGIQANDLIGRKIAAEGGRTAGAVAGEIRTLAGHLDQSGDAGLVEVGLALAAGCSALEAATAWVVEHRAAASRIAASAVPYLNLAGTVLGGWLLARGALAAHRALGERPENAGFLRARLATARFHAAHVMPLAQAHAHAVVHGADAALALDPEEI